MLITLGFLALIVGVVLIVCGYTIAPQALRPGFGCLILALILILLGYLIPVIVTHTYDHPVSYSAPSGDFSGQYARTPVTNRFDA